MGTNPAQRGEVNANLDGKMDTARAIGNMRLVMGIYGGKANILTASSDSLPDFHQGRVKTSLLPAGEKANAELKSAGKFRAWLNSIFSFEGWV
jgi:hypothetical protein